MTDPFFSKSRFSNSFPPPHLDPSERPGLARLAHEVNMWLMLMTRARTTTRRIMTIMYLQEPLFLETCSSFLLANFIMLWVLSTEESRSSSRCWKT